ncbi:MAG: ATP-binding protein [Deltaproteobacteria bacterium]|nr:ATP-binding protein [Deltaproteobacteria bacterium]
MEDLSLHLLDLAENSIRSQATRIEISLVEEMERDLLTVRVKDNGKGMDLDAAGRAVDPFFSTKPGKKVGLGLALLAQAAREAEGALEVVSKPGQGTEVKATFRHSHPDRKPLGDIAATIEVLVAGNPEIDFVFEHRKGGEHTRLDTREMTRS